MIDLAVLFYLFEFRGLNQAAALGKREAFCRHTGSVISKVETSLNISVSERVRDSSPPLGMTNIGTAKVFRSLWRTKDFANNSMRCLRRRRRVDVDVRLALRLGRSCRRGIHNRGVALLFLRRRVCYRRFFLLTSRQKCGAQQEADVFVHVSRTDSDANYLRRR